MRTSEHDISPLILNRWSPRAMSGEKMSDKEVMPLFDAARWAPSSMNNQLWRFVYAKRETKYWDGFFNLLMEGNKVWVKDAAMLVLLISRKKSYHQDMLQVTHSLEAGAAFENLALEGSRRGLVVHGMAGFDYDTARTLLNLPKEWVVECMIAIGKPGNKENLPDALREREMPSTRKPLNEIVFEGTFRE